MQNEKDRSQLSWYKWMIEDAKALHSVLNNEQMGELFFAIMETVETGNVTEVSDQIKIPYALYCVKVENARTAYKNKCEKLAKNGAKGGKAKAKNGTDTKEKMQNDFKPPTKTDFKNAAKYICKKYDFEYDDYEITNLYNRLSEDKWCFQGCPIGNERECLEAIIYINRIDDIETFQFARKVAKRGFSISIDAIEYFWEAQEGDTWKINNQKYHDLQSAIDAVISFWYEDEDEES